MGDVVKFATPGRTVQERWRRRLARLRIALQVVDTGHPAAATWAGGPFPTIWVNPSAAAVNQDAAIARAVGAIRAERGLSASAEAVRDFKATIAEMKVAALATRHTPIVMRRRALKATT